MFDEFLESDMTAGCQGRHETSEGGHGRLENGCHWVLEVAFREDLSRVREVSQLWHVRTRH